MYILIDLCIILNRMGFIFRKFVILEYLCINNLFNSLYVKMLMVFNIDEYIYMIEVNIEYMIVRNFFWLF